jgi:hypothetical protein
MLTIDQLINPLVDALNLDMQLKNGRLYGEGSVDLEVLEGIPVMTKIRIVDSVIDTSCGTVGVLANLGGQLYLAMINDDRVKKLTFFVVDGEKAGLKIKTSGRVDKLDQWGGWSRKKFYSAIAPGVKATFTRPSVSDEWEVDSTGPKAALEYVEMRNSEGKSKTADEWNEEFKNDRMRGKTTFGGGRAK